MQGELGILVFGYDLAMQCVCWVVLFHVEANGYGEEGEHRHGDREQGEEKTEEVRVEHLKKRGPLNTKYPCYSIITNKSLKMNTYLRSRELKAPSRVTKPLSACTMMKKRKKRFL